MECGTRRRLYSALITPSVEGSHWARPVNALVKLVRLFHTQSAQYIWIVVHYRTLLDRRLADQSCRGVNASRPALSAAAINVAQSVWKAPRPLPQTRCSEALSISRTAMTKSGRDALTVEALAAHEVVTNYLKAHPEHRDLPGLDQVRLALFSAYCPSE